ncbi:oxysterol-binding protein-related protein 7 isoform X1 [Tachyglossus aculeatus]|uniref:oxysterol-binding protein-related protein 7 isoform X1 n=1 Tax=Tachyglossus aculeatus TaxID=9261 RepID=UPI0018F4C981|nr:oxysterol-binding protein-related protein 7 isoform X1 [Tachyglossus aculeatus]
MDSHDQDVACPRRAVSQALSASVLSYGHSTTQQSSELWEVVEEPRARLGAEGMEPERQEGNLLKKRKWPLKGWHKRYFVLEGGILRYATTRQDIAKGKLHGSIDVRLSVMSVNKKAQRIDLDTEDNIYHLKIKSQDLFHSWVSRLCAHRLAQPPNLVSGSASHRGPVSQGPGTRLLAPALPSPQGCQEKVASWLKNSEGLDRCSHELSECQDKLQELYKLLQSLESLHRTPSAPVISSHQQATGSTERPKKGKRTSRMWCTQSYTKDDTIGRVGRLHSSVPNLSRYLEPSQPPGTRPLPPEYVHLQRSFWVLAQKVHGSLSSVLTALSAERDRLRESRGRELHRPGASDVQPGPRRLHSLSASSDTTADSFSSLNPEEEAFSIQSRELVPPLPHHSVLSLADSHTEFFDACEVFLSTSSSADEGSDEDEASYTSEVTTSLSEGVPGSGASEHSHTDSHSHRAPLPPVHPAGERGAGAVVAGGAGIVPRRRCLPGAGGPGVDVSLWHILRNNIGKDLSKVSMPVQLNEPLNTLQRLCEELEYSALLDQASRSPDPCERMVCIAAFAVSAYASTYHRAGCKPFNPVLGETYECERPDRGFRFISEQVSHHPPVSACHAESDNFIFWQDMKWKNKFWGKSLEVVPVGTVHVRLPRFGDHYEWNKVTSCIHNILSGQRWVEHYGEVLIRNTQDSSCHCKITFCKAKYWSASVNEVQGAVYSSSGRVLHRLFGKWHEGLYRGSPPHGQCIWKPNTMPPNHERNYGFTQFALELNELTTELKRALPSTDTRLRPDQRYLEEGNVQAAESQKRRIEQLQRDRRRVMEENNLSHQARFFRRQTDSSGKEWWVSNNTYWRLRAEPGYGNMDGAVLW